MTYTVVFTPEAEEQLAALYRYIEGEASLSMPTGCQSSVCSTAAVTTRPCCSSVMSK